MRFSILTLVTLVSAVSAANIKRQNSDVQVNAAAMTDQEGNIIPFDTANVYQANRDAGL